MLMELDTGAAVSIMSEESFQRIAGKGVTLKPSNTRLTSYTGGTITVLGMAEVDMTVQESVQPNTSYTLPVIVVKGPIALGPIALLALLANKANRCLAGIG